jgi:hypothetical protein
MNDDAWGAIHAAIHHRFLRCVLTYKSTLRALLGTGGASQRASRPIRHRSGCGYTTSICVL